MKKLLLNGLLILFTFLQGVAQITTPIIKAAFGVDADLRANIFNNFNVNGNDDWFSDGTPGTGRFVIDTTGAAALVAAYLSDVSPFPRRMTPTFRTMSVPEYSVINNRLWIDAHWVRDHHGQDSTVFSAGSNKNGDSPANWSSPVVQAIPDKNDILDAFLHYRRAGPSTTDSLWMFTALSLDNVTGNRYFDFELYQTDIYFDRPTRKWYGYGPDMGHTSWTFDAAGNVVQAGDVIFSAKFQSSTLTEIEARIWVARSSLLITPTQFNWAGAFDGAYSSAPFGYASIRPNTSGNYYSGLGCNTNTWAGPFMIVRQDNSVAANYIRDQFMEFSVNLSKLGLDPAKLFGSNFCGSPFNRFVVKTRTSESFTSELKDFIAPLTMFFAPRVNVAAEVPIFCVDTATSFINVTNPHPTSVYNWSTVDGNIISPPTGPQIQVNRPGTYDVAQYLAVGCDVYAAGSSVVRRSDSCKVLPGKFLNFSGNYDDHNRHVRLRWSVLNNTLIRSFVIERSINGESFSQAGTLVATDSRADEVSYDFSDPVSSISSPYIDYRIKMIDKDGSVLYTRILRFSMKAVTANSLSVTPNPVINRFQLTINSTIQAQGRILIYDLYGRQVKMIKEQILKGVNNFTIETEDHWQPGTYTAVVQLHTETLHSRFIVIR